MRPSGSLVQLVAVLASMTPLAAAWGPVGHHAIVRADASETPSQTDKPSAGQSASSGGPQQTNLNTAEPSKTDKPKSGDASATKSSDKSSKTGDSSSSSDSGDNESTIYPPDAQNGIAVMTQPPATAIAVALYRIGTNVTMGWNYTNLPAPPKYIDILVTETKSKAIWTITQNMTYTSAVNFVWDTTPQGNDPSNPLYNAQYQLIVKDNAVGLKDTPVAGHLSPNYPFWSFGLYKAGPYVPLSQFSCPGCSSASSLMNKQSMGFAVGMSFAAAVVGAGLF